MPGCSKTASKFTHLVGLAQSHDHEGLEEERLGIAQGPASLLRGLRLGQFVNEQNEFEQERIGVYHGFCCKT